MTPVFSFKYILRVLHSPWQAIIFLVSVCFLFEGSPVDSFLKARRKKANGVAARLGELGLGRSFALPNELAQYR